MYHPYYQRRDPAFHIHSVADRTPPARAQTRRPTFVGGLSSNPFRGRIPRALSDYRQKQMPSIVPPPSQFRLLPPQLLYTYPIYPLPYPAPLPIPATYVYTPVVLPTCPQPYVSEPRRNNFTVRNTGPDRTPRASRSGVKLPFLTSSAAKAQQPQPSCACQPQKLFPFHSQPPVELPGQRANRFFFVKPNFRGLPCLPNAWRSYKPKERFSSSNIIGGHISPHETLPNGLVLPCPGMDEMNWPPEESLKLESNQWMIHPRLLWDENQLCRTTWKWDMNNYPKPESILEVGPSGVVYPVRREDLNAPVIYSSTQKTIKIFITDWPMKPLEFRDNLTVKTLFLTLWQVLDGHMRKDWKSWLKSRNLEHVIPILEENRTFRLEKLGKLAAIAEDGRPPKWIDVFGGLVLWAGLVPLNDSTEDPQQDVKMFRLRHARYDDAIRPV